ncbi:MAG: hypothetical protein CO029_03265 [Candidatus Magasanikbacteria bacterium CG_4_9_14_0_2_um_filter_41_10]|nr:MAG: hypothetical protein AUJ37_03580 [Candidatus Magasanikbacteria bacterium CG1_02_41_34]PJC53346.1 MAG: hypothetical protein CO029_03265 [Candidatus Magasanikbacteria bacterium CG_4_9_14_0_2_um_filter_41_10]
MEGNVNSKNFVEKKSTTNEKPELELGRAFLHIIFNVVAFVLVVMPQVTDADIDATLIGFGIAVPVVETFMITGYWTSKKWAPGIWYANWYEWFYKHIARWFIRPKERGKLTAMSSYLLGLVVIRLVFHAPMIEALFIMTILSWGDPAARIGGKSIEGAYLPGRKDKKTWAGFLSFIFVASLMVLFLDLGLVATGALTLGASTFMTQYFAVLAGGLAEAYVPWWDNFFITLASYGTYAAIMG